MTDGARRLARAARRTVLSLCLLGGPQAARADAPLEVAMTADHWQGSGEVEYVQMEGFPHGQLNIKRGTAVLRALTFGNGTIEFDVKLVADGIPGIQFRRRGETTAEELYVRPGPNCRASQDCIQYAPIVHSTMLWDVYPNYQRAAPIDVAGWNHIKLVISGRRMNVFVNATATPTLAIDRLEGDALDGDLMLTGPATFANLTVTRDAVEGLSPEPTADPTLGDPRWLRHWSVAPPSVLAADSEPTLAALPASTASWATITAERDGLINIARRYGSPTGKGVTALTWLKTSVVSDRDQAKAASIGWTREIWIFVNGKQVYAGNNGYNDVAARKAPDGRLSIDNGSVILPLRKGKNEITIALSNRFAQSSGHYGWGMKLRLEDVKGIDTSGGGPASGTRASARAGAAQ